MLVIIDYQSGNLGSIRNMLKKAEVESVISSDPSVIAEADKLILPGVGAFDYGMKHLQDSGLIPVLNQKVITEKTPVLGICLGMQLLGKSSEEGECDGLNWIDATCLKFRFPGDHKLKVPHMGWSEISIQQSNGIFGEMYPEPRFYFVHSYFMKCENPTDIAATAHYGIDFTCAVQRQHIMGVQFHPEKSHKFGLKLLQQFSKLKFDDTHTSHSLPAS